MLGLVVALVVRAILKVRGDIAPDEAHRWVEDGALLLDVRTPGEFSAGHLPDARNVPVAELGRRLDELGTRDRPIVVYCRSGARSAVAKSVLLRAGFEKVANLGGMSRW